MLTTPQQQLIDALRSGEYQKTEGCLCRDGDKFCVMGVMCELYRKTFPNKLKVQKLGDTYYITSAGFLYALYLPPEVSQWMGLSNPCGFFNNELIYNGELCDGLMNLNDAGASFTELADIIENHAAELFVC